MRGLIIFLVVTVLGIALGAGGTAGLLYLLLTHGQVQNGPWRGNLTTGSAEADPYVRLGTALYGLLALNRSETIYFSASKDSRGEPFDGRCSYWIEGRDPDARWWSITAYGRDMYLIPNSANLYSISQSSVARKPDGSFRARASLTPDTVNGLATAREGFVLLLRLYNPGAAAQASPQTTPLPAIVKDGCS